ncbi:proteasome assembly chaperone family protein [Sulfodiicoccus acidiphilus]|uniref:proteasome assembly chaperone family protein n=1 Tax=Sulfodiicoccus acidiphilus TaxID=1670455 RepID=UPI0035715EBB
MSYETVMLEEPTLPKPRYLFVGLPDAGLVGQIAAEYLIRETRMAEVAHFYLQKLSPTIVQVSGGLAKPPIRLYYSQNMLVFNSWVAIPPALATDVAELVCSLATKFDVYALISVTGIPVPNRLDLERLGVYWITSNEELAKETEKMSLAPRFDEGYIAGPYAPILLESKRRGLRNLVVTVESFLDLPDPEASAAAIEVVSKFTGFSVSTDNLLKEAEAIRARIRGLMEETKKNISGRAGPTTYA